MVTSGSRKRSQTSKKINCYFTADCLLVSFSPSVGCSFLLPNISHTEKDNPTLVSGQVIENIGHYFSFEDGKDQQFLVFYRTVRFDSELRLRWSNGNLESSKDLPKLLELVKAENGFVARILTCRSLCFRLSRCLY